MDLSHTIDVQQLVGHQVMNSLSLIVLLAVALSSSFTSAVPFSLSCHAVRALRAGSSEPPPPAVETLVLTPAVLEGVDAGNSTDNTTIIVDYKLGPNAPSPGYIRRRYPNFPYYRIPNMITALRCATIPSLIPLFYQPNKHVATATLFAFASMTDWFDGYIARLWDITTPLGALIDTVADKLMVATTLVLLAGRYGVKIAIPTAIIVSREIAVTALREWMAQQGVREAIQFKFQGKVKTAVTMLALTILLLVPRNDEASSTGFLSRLFAPGLALLYLCTVLTVTSGIEYFRAAAPYMMGTNVISTPESEVDAS
jgi:CDP-diacylglycerol---glycerol-3-phosphate 3-phosphatidyltransferase